MNKYDKELEEASNKVSNHYPDSSTHSDKAYYSASWASSPCSYLVSPSDTVLHSASWASRSASDSKYETKELNYQIDLVLKEL